MTTEQSTHAVGNADWLRQVMAEYAYPGIVLGVFVLLAAAAVRLVVNAPNGTVRTRRLVAVAVPVIVLVLVVPGTAEQSAEVARSLASLPAWVLGLLGLVLGCGLIELSRILFRFDSEIVSSMYSMLLSALVSTLLWALAFGAVDSLRWMLVVGIAGAGLDIVFRGVPRQEEAQRAASAPGTRKCPNCGKFIAATRDDDKVQCGKCKYVFTYGQAA